LAAGLLQYDESLAGEALVLAYGLWPIDKITGSTRGNWIITTNVTVDVSEPDLVPAPPGFEVWTENGTEWISVEYLDSTVFDQGSGRFYALFTYRIVINPSAGNLAYGSYSGGITFSNPGWSQTVPVTLAVPSGLTVLKPASGILYLDEGNGVGIYYGNLFPLPYSITAWNPMYKLTTSPLRRAISNSVGSAYFRVQALNPPLTGGPQYLFFIGQDGATCSIQVLQRRPPNPPPDETETS
jgi:hypothetical protein